MIEAAPKASRRSPRFSMSPNSAKPKDVGGPATGFTPAVILDAGTAAAPAVVSLMRGKSFQEII
jgi:hypothetical protein